MGQLTSEVHRTKKELPKCPYCGGKMHIGDGAEIEAKQPNFGKEMSKAMREQLHVICNNFPTCDSYGRIHRDISRNSLISTPANKELRNLRREAHFWMNKLVETGVYPDAETVYAMITPKLSLGGTKLLHIGECREYACKEICKICIEVLYDRRSEFERFRGYYNGYKKDRYLFDKVCAISYIGDNK